MSAVEYEFADETLGFLAMAKRHESRAVNVQVGRTLTMEQAMDVLVHDDSLTPKDRIKRLGDVLVDALGEVDPPTIHFFLPGVVFRQCVIEAGCMIVGRIQKFEHIFCVLKGDISIYDDEGNIVRIQSPATFNSHPGRQRVGFAHEDTVCGCIYQTDHTDEDTMKEHVSCATWEEYQQFVESGA